MDIKQAVYDHWAKLDNEPPRPHLGASIIGHECERYLWYSFRWAFSKAFGGRMHRLFEFGRQSEDRFSEELLAVGVRVVQTDANGKQFHVTADFGHFGGSCDGCAEIDREWHVVEYKTHGDKSFKELEQKGVKDAKPQHFVQMQVYMGFIGLKKALYYAENKNTSEIHVEIVEFDQRVFDWALARARRVVFANEPAEKIGGPDWYKCKWCDAYELCHQSRVPKKNCRTCINSTPNHGGGWLCKGYEIPAEVMAKGCGSHVFNPHLLPWEAIDAGDGYILYDGGICNAALTAFPAIVGGDAPSIFTSDEICKIEDLAKINVVATVKKELGGEVQ